MILENEKFYFFRKPAGVPSTRGNGDCFLDQLKNGTYAPMTQEHLHDISLPDMYTYFIDFYKTIGLVESSGAQEAIGRLLQIFSQDQEYGLVNRLDSDTS